MRLYAFEGLHYPADPEAAGALCAQPYDQINTASGDRSQLVAAKAPEKKGETPVG